MRGIHDMLERSGLALSDLDACVLPEGNAEYFASEYGTAGLSDEDQAVLSKTIVENLTDVGATGSAAVPLALDAGWAEGRIRPGHKVLLLAIEASRYVYAGLTLTWEAPPFPPGSDLRLPPGVRRPPPPPRGRSYREG